MRFAWNAVDPHRLRTAVERRIRDVPHAAAWVGSDLARRNRAGLERLRNKHAGERCVIMGNGPSLARMDLASLARETTFGLNRIYLLFDKLTFRPTYYVCSNELVLDQFHHEIAAQAGTKFINWSRRGLFAKDSSVLFLRHALPVFDFFGADPTRTICSGGTVTYVALQLAFFLGFARVILIGVDHRFADQGPPNREAVRVTARDDNHFHPDYFPRGTRWQLPDLVRSEHDYRLARRAYERAGREIVDATLDGQCQIFEKRSLEAALAAR